MKKRTSKASLVGKRFNDSLVYDYDAKGLYLRDDNGNEAYEEYDEDYEEEPEGKFNTLEEETMGIANMIGEWYYNYREKARNDNYVSGNLLTAKNAAYVNYVEPSGMDGKTYYEVDGDKEYVFEFIRYGEDSEECLIGFAKTTSQITGKEITLTYTLYLDLSKITVEIKNDTLTKTVVVPLKKKVVVEFEASDYTIQ